MKLLSVIGGLMPDYEQTRRKKEAEANARTALEREERRKIETKEETAPKKTHERRHWEGIAMAKKKKSAMLKVWPSRKRPKRSWTN